MDDRPHRERPLRHQTVDGDDVWPQDLAADDLAAIARLDRAIESDEQGRFPTASKRAGGAVFSVAERVRHWRGLVEDLEGNVPVDAGVYATELGCRDLIMKYLGQMPPRLHDRLMIDLVEPLDMRFEAVTVDDGGAALADRVRIGDLTDRGWWWRRRPKRLPDTWA